MIKFYTKTLLLYFIFSLNGHLSFSHHITGVGLDMQAINVNGKNFRITLNLYTDDFRQPLATIDERVAVFRKRDNAFMTLIVVARPITPTPPFLIFENPKCAENNNLKIYRNSLSLDVFFDPAIYNDSQGYYLVFDRCCRSEELTNIANPRDTASSIILEFPPVDNPKNSSPIFQNQNGNILCKNQPFTASFKATDADGDILKYSLIDPLKGYARFGSTDPNTNVFYDLNPRSSRPSVDWLPGFSKNTAISGNPALRINDLTGEISVTPNQTGIFVFCVLVEEYRNGVKIGSNRIDYSLKVVDCLTNNLPKPIINYNGTEAKNLTVCSDVDVETANNTDWQFQWKKDGINIPNANTNTYKITDNGIYTVVKSSKSACAKEVVSEELNIAKLANNAKPTIKSDKTGGCDGEKIILTLENPNLAVDWYFNNTFQKNDKTLTANKSGDYEAKIVGISSCPSSNTSDKITINLSIKPEVSPPTNDYKLCVGNGNTVKIATKNNPDYTYQWYKDNALLLGGNVATFATDQIGNFLVKVKFQECEVESQIFKVVAIGNCGATIPSENVFIPTAFTPNGDGENDVLEIFNLDKFPNVEVYIYNRWGEILFQSKNYTQKWDGTFKGFPVQSGIYLVKIKLNDNTKNDVTHQILVLK